MTVLTQTEAEDLAAAYEWAKSTGDPEPFSAVLDAAVAARVAEARRDLDALREAVRALADEWQRQAALNERAGHFPWAMWQNRANDLRALVPSAPEANDGTWSEDPRDYEPADPEAWYETPGDVTYPEANDGGHQ